MLDYNYFYLCDIEKEDCPDEKDVYFYDLSDDTVFRTDDPEIYNNLFNWKIGRWLCITKIHSKIDSILAMIQGILFLLVLFSATLISELKYLYIFNWIDVVLNYIVLCALCNREMKKIKNRSEVFQVIKSGNDSDRKQGTIETQNVKEYMKISFKKHNHFGDYIVYLPALILSIIFPYPIFPFFQITGLDCLPHNHLRLLWHLNKINA